LICSISDCTKKVQARGWCSAHYKQWEKYGDPLIRKDRIRGECSLEDCALPHLSKGYCSTHYYKWKRNGDPLYVPIRKIQAKKLCSIEDCSEALSSKGYCDKHYRAYRKYGDALLGRKVTGRTLKSDGYVALSGYYDHPNADKAGIILEHRFVMATHLNRALLPGENVHHKNGIRDDNDISNLELWSTSQPSGQRVEDKTAWTVEWLQTYAPELLKEI
jgi:hypothetical protein